MFCLCCVLEDGYFLIPKHGWKFKFWLWPFWFSLQRLTYKKVSFKFLVLGTVSSTVFWGNQFRLYVAGWRSALPVPAQDSGGGPGRSVDIKAAGSWQQLRSGGEELCMSDEVILLPEHHSLQLLRHGLK